MWKKSSFSSDSGTCVEVFRISSFSGSGGSCVAVARGDEKTLVRNSNDPDGPVVAFTEAEWQAFIPGVKAGEFD